MIAGIVIAVVLAILALFGAVKVEAMKVRSATARAEAAQLELQNAKVKHKADLASLDGKYAKSQSDLKELRARELERGKAAAASGAKHDAADAAAAGKIANASAAAQQRTQGDPNAKAVATVHELARDLMRNQPPR